MNINVDKRWFERKFAQKGLSLRDLARTIGMDPGALSRALNGKRKITVDEVAKIATVLDVTASEVLAHVTARGGEWEAQDNEAVRASSASARVHPLFGCLKGMLTIPPGVDLTEPADPELVAYLDRKYGDEVRDTR